MNTKHVIQTDVILEFENDNYLVESDISFDGNRHYFVSYKLQHGGLMSVGNYFTLEEAKLHAEIMS